MIRDVRRKISASLKACYVAHNLHCLTNHSIQMMNKPLCMQINNEDSGAYSFVLIFFFCGCFILTHLTQLLLYNIVCIFMLYRMVVIPNTERDYIIIQTHNTLWNKHSHVHCTHRYGIEMAYIRKYAVLSGTVAMGG